MHRLLLLAGGLLLTAGITTNWFAMNCFIVTSLILLPLVLLTFLYKQATADNMIHIGELIILQKGVFKKSYPWTAVQQLVIKDGLLTIDLKSNKLIQHLIQPDPSFIEADFNSYCQHRFNQSIS